MTSKVLITGATGLFGLNAVAALHETFNVVAVVNNRDLPWSQIRSVRGDLRKTGRIDEIIADEAPDYVLNCAGLANVDECEANPDLAHEMNAALPGRVAGAAQAANAKLIHISTDHLFDGTKSLVGENGEIRPLNHYARTKADGEEEVRQADPNALIVRCNFFGWGPSYRNSFSDFVLTAAEQGREIGLFEDVFFTPASVTWVIGRAMELAAMDAAGIFNVSGSQRLSKLDFGLKLLKSFGLRDDIVSATRLADSGLPATRPLDMSLSNRKTLDTLQCAAPDILTEFEKLRTSVNQPMVKGILAL